MEDNSNLICFDGDIKPAGSPLAGAQSRGLMYGDGVFETFRTYGDKVLFLKKHLERLRGGLDELDIKHPEAVRTGQISDYIQTLKEQNDLAGKDAVIRLQVWREGARGYHPDDIEKSHFMISASSCPAGFKPIELATVETKRIPSQSLPSKYKFTNGINYILAAQQASRKGADDALMETLSGYVSETTIANIFWRKGSTIFTPSKECELLPGITRAIVMDIIRRHGKWNLEEDTYNIDHLADAEAVWVCNSVREIVAVQKINDETYNIDDPLLAELKDRFHDLVNKNLKPLY
ncbi:branched-chain amino acid aminotransferase [Fodinibius salinus]|uniref:Branched-chain amino acid aminotransferase n=1 Tax=Fodinibius salinus TaxID=860790 RepID=A0A5D3YNM3_9BACT|nr:aminotransferase class IV [Fodinibius salinus]TYP95282.1 branched-chain amino acid aminotransferase [Fodinibius salinus]